jgi:hypothetical protein
MGSEREKARRRMRVAWAAGSGAWVAPPALSSITVSRPAPRLRRIAWLEHVPKKLNDFFDEDML